MFRSNRFMLLIGLLLIASMALVACAAPPPPAAAPAAGAVAGEVAASTELNVLCTPQVEWCEGMKAEFEKANPTITVNFRAHVQWREPDPPAQREGQSPV